MRHDGSAPGNAADGNGAERMELSGPQGHDGVALTFDDVLLVPRDSEVLPPEVDTTTRLCDRLELNIPLVSAAMDTVTESRLAVALARLGGLGVIHRNMSVDRQGEEVDRVKRSEAGMVLNPVKILPDRPVGEALELMARFHISGVPVVDDQDHLVGIVTNRDLRFHEDPSVAVREVMTPQPILTAPIGTDLAQARRLLQGAKVEKLPIVDREGRLRGLITVKDITKQENYPLACKDGDGRLRVGAAIGVGDEALARAKALIEAEVDVICVDVAHGHQRRVLDTVAEIREQWPRGVLIAGNVVTREGTAALAEAGADVVKVGVGPGSICTTRVVTGVGYPQWSAIAECAAEARRHGVGILADGGIRFSGDIAKAIGAGGHAVMLGSLLAGVEESPGELTMIGNRPMKRYRGMGSLGAMSVRSYSKDRYAQESVSVPEKVVPEGVEGNVAYRGPLGEVVHQLVGGLRQAMGYCGTRTIAQLHDRARFVRVSPTSMRESHPHDLTGVIDAPNYWASDL
ncbi:MAG: inosine-5-monophosphate dehydrogenase [Acidimicrobiaceae bacterium]|nr:inosine-5-monophosphate dehydrogenase [Acidimicrobiaceae bacterium]